MNNFIKEQKGTLIFALILMIFLVLTLFAFIPRSVTNSTTSMFNYTTQYADFQKKSINKLKIQQAYVLNYNMYSKIEQASGNSYTSKDYWSIVCADSSGNAWVMQVASDGVKIQSNTNQNRNTK